MREGTSTKHEEDLHKDGEETELSRRDEPTASRTLPELPDGHAAESEPTHTTFSPLQFTST